MHNLTMHGHRYDIHNRSYQKGTQSHEKQKLLSLAVQKTNHLKLQFLICFIILYKEAVETATLIFQN